MKEGPQRVRLWFSHVRFLDRHVADTNQYLVVQFRDGSKAHHRGPVALFFDPCIHEKVELRDAYKLAANEALVIYNEAENSAPAVGEKLQGPNVANGALASTKTVDAPAISPEEEARQTGFGRVERRIVRGPCVFIPSAMEWVHTFSWHGSIHEGKGSKTGTLGDQKQPHAINFEKLRCISDQMYLSVRDVRTSDDAKLTVHLMIFYELLNIEKMLDNTNDPIGDFVNAASADVMTFGAANTYEGLMERTSLLSQVETFPLLTNRMEQTGYKLAKVIYRGLATSDQLQAMHDEATTKRTKLRLASDTAQVEQEQQTMQLRCKQERSEREQQLHEAEARHKLALLALSEEQKRKDRDADFAQKMRHEHEAAEAARNRKIADNEEEARRLAALKGMGVELTKYLVAVAQPAPDKHLRIDSVSSPALHLDMK